MFSSRTKGLAKICVAGQCAVATLFFWLWLPLSQRSWELWRLDLSQYAFYNATLVIGILAAYVSAPGIAWFSQRSFFDCQRLTFRQTAFATSLMIFLLAGEKDQAISRLFLFSFLPLLFALLVTTQQILPPLLQKLSFGGIRIQRVLLGGSSGNVPKLQGWLRNKERHGYEIVGVICHDRPAGVSINGINVLGTMDDLESVIRDQDITQVILVEFPRFQNFLAHYTVVCERHGVRLMVTCDFERALRHPVTMFEDEGMRFIALREEPLEDPFGRFSKRCLDLAVALPVVLFVLPVGALVVAGLQRRYSPGPLMFRQLRSGLQNLPFIIYKFRTMHVYNEDASRQATKDDPRIFPGGRWLRKFSVDELPQFLNVLRGDMSVVGPRPHLLEHNDQFAQLLMNYPVRGNVKPGITGLAQVRGYRGETRTKVELSNRVESDIQYIENWSFTMDCWIILRTAVQVLIPPRTAY